MSNMNTNDFYYYLHKTSISEPEMIESLFNDGLKSRYGYSIHSTLARIDETDLQKNGLENEIIGYLGHVEEYNSVVVVKIPKKYFSNRHRDGKIDPALPVFREYSEPRCDWTTLFTPRLIQGVYCRNINKSFTNPNFNPIFNPSGYQYAEEQIERFWAANAMDWINFDKARKGIPFEQLYVGDKSNKIWDQIVNYYSKLYGIQPTPMIKYKMPEEDKKLFVHKTL